MNCFAYETYCVCPVGVEAPAGAIPVTEPFSPLFFLFSEPPEAGRGIFRVDSVEDLKPAAPMLRFLPPQTLDPWIQEHGAGAVNVSFSNWKAVLQRYLHPKKSGLRLTLVGLGDVGGTLLTGLKLLSGETVSEIGIYDPNEAQCLRYEMELNQVLGEQLPKVVLRSPDRLFDCDAFLFTASRGVPPVGENAGDVRMLQFEKNREMLKAYSSQAEGFTGLFCQISDPVDLLARSVFHQAGSLLPEQIQGFGLGVMAARTAYYAGKQGMDFSNGRVYGPHGQGLISVNDWKHYDEEASRKLTELAATANLRVRELGFKPYIAPGLSSGAISVLAALRGEWHYATAPVGGVCFGCRNRYTPFGLELERLPLDDALLARMQTSYEALAAMEEDCKC